MTVYTLLDGGEGISYTDSLLVLVNDILETMVHVGRQEQHSAKFGLMFIGPCIILIVE